MRIATWNVNSLKARLPRVEAWLAECEPDILCMQETKLADSAFPSLTFSALGYEAVHHGEGRWNGVAILSRVGLDDAHGRLRARRRDRATTRLASCRRRAAAFASRACTCPTVGRSTTSSTSSSSSGWAGFGATSRPRATRTPTSLVCGDFNIAPEDRDVWDPNAVHGATHVSEPGARRARRARAWGLVDVFRRHYDEDRAVLVVGLPRGQLPQAPRHADRSDAREQAARRALAVGAHRPQRPQGTVTVRSRAADRRLRPSAIRHERSIVTVA